MKVYKGFNKDMTCTPDGKRFQFEEGKTYEEPSAKLCESGFHACEAPLDVFRYYPPATSVYHECELNGVKDERKEDSKVCGSKITIGAEIGIIGLAKAHVEFIKEKVKKNKIKSNTGNWSAATNTGDQSAATNTGNWSAASVSGKESVAIAIGYSSKAKGALGCFIVLAEYKETDSEQHLVNVISAKVDGENIKPDTWYRCVDGQFVVCEDSDSGGQRNE